MEHNYRISFKIGDSSFEIESTDLNWLESKEKEYFQKILAEVSKHREAPKHRLESQTEKIPTPETTLQEFYRQYIQKQVKSRPNIAVFFVYYLQKVMKEDTIKSSDILNCFKKISYPNYNKLNMTAILNNGKRRALINYVNKLWSLTTTGEDYVLNTITGKEK